MGFRADVRAACVTMLSAYASANSVKLQVYPGRPRSLAPPTAFVDRIPEAMNLVGLTTYQRRPNATIVVIHGLFDHKDSVEQADAFVDGFMAWVVANPHAAGANTLVGDISIEDEPNYVPDWLPQAEQRAYYATLISVEGFAGI